MTEGKRNIIHQLLEEYDIQTAEDIQDALKDLLGGTIKEMMEAEMDDHLGYEKSERSDNDDYRNGYKRKRVNSSYGAMEIEVPQDRKSTFEPQVVKKRQKDISDIDQKIISMYAKGMTTRQISETIEDIYGFETSEGFISDVTDKILPQIEDWQNRPLDEVYPILYIDAIHYSVRDNGIIRKLAAYVILDINTEGKKEVLTINVGDNESWDLCFVIILLSQTVVRTLSRQPFFYTVRYSFPLFYIFPGNRKTRRTEVLRASYAWIHVIGVLPVKRTMKNNNFFSISLLTGWRYFYAAFNVSS